MKPNRPHLRALTGIRFFAAIHVVVMHFGLAQYVALADGVRDRCATHGFPRLGSALHAVIYNVFHSGSASVSLFFVLSGFILAFNYLTGPRPTVDARRFYWARFARIYPVYLLGIVLMAPFMILIRLTSGDTIARAAMKLGILGTASVTLVQAWVPSLCAWNWPAWSLSAEAFFYLCFPLVAVPLVRARTESQLFRRMILMTVLAMVGPAVFVMRFAAHHPLVQALHHMDDVTGTSVEWFKFSPLLRLPEFLLGALAGRLFLLRHGASPDKAMAGRGAGVSAVLVLAALALSSWVPYIFYHNGLFAPLFALLIYKLAMGRGIIARVLATPVLNLLGEASYATYILQFPIMYMMVELKIAISSGLAAANSRAFLQTDQGASFFWLFLLVLVVGSVVALKLVEEPARRAIRAFASGRPAPRNAPADEVPIGAAN